MRTRWRRTKEAPKRGEVIHDGNDDHRCYPPGCSEWPAGKWYVEKVFKYPEGTVWRCWCGDAWRCTNTGLWLNWVRNYANDAKVDA